MQSVWDFPILLGLVAISLCNRSILPVSSLLWSKARQFSLTLVTRYLWTISHQGDLMGLRNVFTFLNLFKS